MVEALIKSGAFDALHADRTVGAGPSQAGHAPSGGRAEGAGGRASMLASVGLAFEFAESQAAHADQGGLFDFGANDEDQHAASTQEPALVNGPVWSIRERLMAEKAALGFYLSGHLFDQNADEVRRFAKRRIADLIDSREPQLLAGIVTDLRIVNGQRGKVAIFKLDDKTDAIETVVADDLLAASKDWLKDDELVVIQGKVQPDRFSGGVRLNASALWDLAGARCRFGKFLRVELNGSIPPVADLLRDFPSRRVASDDGARPQGLTVRLALHRTAATGELDLGDAARFFPSDAALARWRASARAGRADIVYE